MQEIVFKQTHNVFLDNGIIGLYRYLQRATRDELPSWMAPLRPFNLREGEHFNLTNSELRIMHERLFDLLEEVYYVMGKEVYDTFTPKQETEGGNLYFNEDGTSFWRFPKMNTYGVTELLTNNAQGVTRLETNTRKFAAIEKDNPVLASAIQQGFSKAGIKMLSKIYFNEPYTKLTRLEKPIKAYFEEGPNACYLTGESVKRLVDGQNISPFISGITMFNSYLNSSDKKVSWKALYLSRFAPVTSLYIYPNKLREGLNVYFVYSDTLTNLNDLLSEKLFGGLMKDRDVLKQHEFLANFPKNDENNALGKGFDYIGVNENLFYLLFTLLKQILGEKPTPETYARRIARGLFTKTVGLVSIRADAFASTMRPSRFEYLSHFRYAIDIINRLEKQGINFRSVLGSLKLIKPSLKGGQNSYALERQLREQILERVLNGKTIIDDIEGYYVDCYGYLLDSLNDPTKNIGFKHYNQIFNFLNAYETTTNPIIMENADLQSRALKLGAQVGQGILNYAENDRKTNARQGRKYIISLRKANQFDRFLAELSRIQTRFTLNFSRDLLEGVNADNYAWIKQFIIISALNQINPELSPKSSTSNENK
ncbi:hypothetical protein [uncultured Spirosoma sp.]|uniref:hypothetical protein n=1 Tax=uncultured Spirosoma sp. TaxID=278208 RepID=UPI00258FAF28|nr:hypothetical protein [uncultured Spirosoma sp.]